MSDEAHSLQSEIGAPGGEHQESRRDFLLLVAGAVGAVAVVATGYAVVDSLNPAADILAAGGPGRRRSEQGGARPAGNRAMARQADLYRRPHPGAAQGAAGPQADRAGSAIRAPSTNQQPPYADNWHRSINPQYAVIVGSVHPSRLHPTVLPKARPEQSGTRLAGRLFLPLSRIEVRSGGPGVRGRARALQPAGSAISLP